MNRDLSYLNPWSNGDIKPGCIVILQFFHNDDFNPDSDDIRPYIVANDRNKHYSLVSLEDGEVIATADSIDSLKHAVEAGCNSDIKILQTWTNVYDWGIEL